MCGIAGVHGWTDDGVMDDMLSCLTHRGPDDDGRYVDDGVMMGMRRLSIIDLEGGAQPISNEDGSVTVVFNGEIYNYRALRRELEEMGHSFATESDTEVLVHLWEEHGVETPEHLNGMFAFAIWDADAEQLFLARDRLGIKPLYVADTDDGVVWGSELPAVLAAGVDRALDERAVYNYFSIHYSPWPRTMFAAVDKLRPGSSLLVDGDDVTERRYWELEYGGPVEGGMDAVADRLREHLERAVERRLVADVPVGAFLSGGLDSSTVVGLMSEMREGVKTFSVGFASSSDESDEARFVAEHFGTDHHEVTVDLDDVDLFGDLVRYYGEPLPDPAVLPTMALAEYTRDHVKVVQTGSGADEIFGGYWMHRRIPRHRRYADRLPGGLYDLVGAAARHAPIGRPYLAYLASLQSDERAVVEAASRFEEMPVDRYLDTELDAHASGLYGMVRDSFERAPPDDTLKKISAFYLRHWLPDDILYKVDHATMSASLEARVPFLDHELVEFAYDLPSRYVARSGEYKPLLKRAVGDLLPQRTLDREKQGFGIQQGEWLRDDHEAIARWLAEDRLDAVPYLDASSVSALRDAHRGGDGDHGNTLWKILNYVAWYHEHAIE